MFTLDRNELDIDHRFPIPLGRAESPNRYPAFHQGQLRNVLADSIGVPTDCLAVTAGAAHALQLVLSTVCKDDSVVLYLEPTFSAFPGIIRSARATPIPVPIPTGRPPLDALFQSTLRIQPDVVILCNPHNPNGYCVDGSAIAAFIASLPPHTVVIVDEVYRDFCRRHEPLKIDLGVPATSARVIHLRSLSKSHGLAALRVGYCVSQPDIISSVNSFVIPFSVSDASAEAAIFALTNHEASMRIARARARTIATRDEIVGVLRRRGIQVGDSCGNFIWLPRYADSDRLVARIVGAGFRILEDYSGGYRISIPGGESSEDLLSIMAGDGGRIR